MTLELQTLPHRKHKTSRLTLFTETMNAVLLNELRNNLETNLNDHYISPLIVKLMRYSTAWRQLST